MKGVFPVAHGRLNFLTLFLFTDARFFTLNIPLVRRDKTIMYPENLQKIQDSRL
jgi:hypothetical protein